MSHLNYNHLYYFWMVTKKGSVTKAAEALFLTPQTVTGQIRQLEERLRGKLFKRKGRTLEPTELGQLVYRYADRMFLLSYEMLDIVNYRREDSILFDVGVADALGKQLAANILLSAIPESGRIHLRCFESTHELLLEQLGQHKLDMILSDHPVNPSMKQGIFDKKIGECGIAFFSQTPSQNPFPYCLEEQPLLLPGKRSAMGQKLTRWLEEQGLQPRILGEFDDVALMIAFGMSNQGIFVGPSIQSDELLQRGNIHILGQTDELKEEFYLIFAERMIQHPAVKRLCETAYPSLSDKS